MRRGLIYILIICISVVACRKFYSYECGTVLSFIAKGSLLDSAGNCQRIIVNGNYLKDTALNSNNYITVQANITAIGKYKIYSDTINGYWFSDTGTISNTGVQNFTLKGYGKPLTPLTASFIVHFDTSVCYFTILINKAVFYFNAPSGNCPDITVNGKYRAGANLNISDSINVPVTVKLPGTYSMQTSLVNGMSFSTQGIFINAGNYIVTLAGTGRPMNTGITQVPINDGNTNCAFPVNVILDTTMYWKCTVEGINYSGLLDSAYGSLPDTGFFIQNNPNRIFATTTGGGDSNNSLNNFGFSLVISRLNTPLTKGIYHSYDILGAADYNGYVQLDINNNSSIITNNYFYTSKNQKEFTINITSFDPVSKLVTGTFSGSVYKTVNLNIQPNTPIVKITNGEFKTYLAH